MARASAFQAESCGFESRLSLKYFNKYLMIGPWCNGNTSDFGSEIPGSNPGGPTGIKTVRS